MRSAPALPIEAPVRVRHTYRQHLIAPADEVFPLLCPVREAEWVEGWAPRLILTDSGLAEPECVFTTPDGDAEAIWTIVDLDRTARVVRFVKVTPGVTVATIDIRVEEAAEGRSTARVTYAWTALSAAGRAVVEGKTPAAWEEFMVGWESALNRFLREQGCAAV